MYATFTERIARLTKDGELDDDGHLFEMSNDDAVDTLHALISEAREIAEISDRKTDDDFGDTCAVCLQNDVHIVRLDADGKSICESCDEL